MNDLYAKIKQLSLDTMERYEPESLKWMWGEALLMHSLGMLQEQNPQIDYAGYIRRYVDHHIAKGYRVDQSDTLAPALAAYYLFKKDPKPAYDEVIQKAIRYIFDAPKVIENMPNHLGHSTEGKLYPKSIWVDSIMMYGVFTSLYAKETANQELMDFAKTQPGFFAKYLQDKEEHLFYHSYWTQAKHTFPRRRIFWGRGNGWVVAGLPMLLDNLEAGAEKDLALKILKDTSMALRQYQREDGFFETVLNRPGKTYPESSATALIAGGWLHAVNHGYLDPSYKELALKSLQAVVGILEKRDGLLSMPWISAPTIPVPLFPYLGYKFTPRGSDWTYGLAALFFAAYYLKEGSNG